jgi:hypothetical protein
VEGELRSSTSPDNTLRRSLANGQRPAAGMLYNSATIVSSRFVVFVQTLSGVAFEDTCSDCAVGTAVGTAVGSVEGCYPVS